MSEEAEIERQLGRLPAVEPDEPLSESIHRRARNVFRREHELAAHPVLRRVDRIYSRGVEPVFVAVAGLVYIGWAVGRVLELLG